MRNPYQRAQRKLPSCFGNDSCDPLRFPTTKPTPTRTYRVRLTKERATARVSTQKLRAIIKFVDAILQPGCSLYDSIEDECAEYHDSFFDDAVASDLEELLKVTQEVERSMTY